MVYQGPLAPGPPRVLTPQVKNVGFSVVRPVQVRQIVDLRAASPLQLAEL